LFGHPFLLIVRRDKRSILWLLLNENRPVQGRAVLCFILWSTRHHNQLADNSGIILYLAAALPFGTHDKDAGNNDQD